MQCPNCKSENSKEAKFCSSCGEKLPENQTTDSENLTQEQATPIEAPNADSTENPAESPIQPEPSKEEPQKDQFGHTSPQQKKHVFNPQTQGLPVSSGSNLGIIFMVLIIGLIILAVGLSVSKNDNSSKESFFEKISSQLETTVNEAIETTPSTSQQEDPDLSDPVALIDAAYNAHNSEETNDNALKYFEQAVAASAPNSFDYFLASAEIAVLEGDTAKSIELFKEALKVDPKSFQVNTSLGLIYLNHDGETPDFEDHPKALEYLLLAKKEAPFSFYDTANFNLALAHFYNDQFEEMPVLLILQAEENPLAAYYLGLSYYITVQYHSAREYLQIAADAGINEAAEILKDMDS